MKGPMSKTKFFCFATVAIVAISFGGIRLFQFVAGDNPYSGECTPKRSRAEIEEACQKHVREADSNATAAIKKRASEFSEFIESRKSGAKPFSTDIVSLYGKWRAARPVGETILRYAIVYQELVLPTAWLYEMMTGEKDPVEEDLDKVLKGEPLFDKESHIVFIAEKFDEHIFSSTELAQAMQRCIEGAVKDIEEIENELAVALRKEILGRSLKPDEAPIAAEEFRTAIERLVAASQWDAAKTVGSLVVSEVAAQVGTQVLARLGVSAGILGAGAANSWWSFGAALVIGIVVDVIWEWIDDPAGDIEREVITGLDKLSIDASTAIEEEMNTIVSQRSELWDKTVTEMLP